MTGRTILCMECGHQQKTTEEYPTLVDCKDCGAGPDELKYKDEVVIEDDQVRVAAYKTIDKYGNVDTDYELLEKPEAVTERLAEKVWNEILVDLESYGVTVVNSSDDVH